MNNFLDRIKHMKCDRCGVIVGLYMHESGWRCPKCIWNEREDLIVQAKKLIDSAEHTLDISLSELNKLEDAVNKATRKD